MVGGCLQYDVWHSCPTVEVRDREAGSHYRLRHYYDLTVEQVAAAKARFDERTEGLHAAGTG